MKDILADVGAHLAIDRAVIYAILTRVWRSLAGLISILMIAKFLTAETQGYYFTFQSLIALQVFVELGLFLVAVNITSHEWVRLQLDETGRLIGDPDALSRLNSFGRRLGRWYLLAALVFVLIMGPAVALFLSGQGNAEKWVAPWVVTVVLQGIILGLTPLLALLEGCNQIVSVQRFQLWQGIVGNAFLWICLILGAGLWSVVGLLSAQVLCTSFYLGAIQRAFVSSFWYAKTGKTLDWRREVWPMQWRVAVQGVVNYLIYSMYTPILFQYHGAVEAGRFGMTWQIFSSLQLLGLAWVQTRVPRFGMLVAQRDFAGLDVLWRHTALMAISVFTLGMGVFLIFQWLLSYYNFEFGQRLLGIEMTVLLLPAGLLTMWVQCAAFYWRAYKAEPLGFSAAIPGLINGTLVWWWGSKYGAQGAIMAYLVMLALISAPLALYLKTKVTREYRAPLEAVR